MADLEEQLEGVAKLRELGLSEYAARAYAATLKLGKAEAKSISTLARVPASKVYEVLGNLEEAGLLEVFPEFPKKYGARSIAPYLDRLHRTHAELASRIERERDALIAVFQPRGESRKEAGSVMVVRGNERILERLRVMLAETRSSWLVLGVVGTVQRYVDLLDDVRAAHHRGVRLRFLLPTAAAPDARRLADVADVRAHRPSATRGGDEVAIALSDGERALLIHWASQSGAAGAVDVAIFTDEPAMVAALESLVEPMWEAGGVG